MTFLQRVWLLVRTVDREAMVFARPARAAVVAFIGLSILVRHQDIRSALPFGVGVLFVAMADRGGPVRTRILPMVGTGIAITAGTFLGGLVSSGTVANIVVGGVVALVCGFAGTAGATWMFGGVLTLVVYTIFGGAPMKLLTATENAVWMAIGGSVLLASALLAHGVARVVTRRSTNNSTGTVAPSTPAVPGVWERARAHLHLDDLYAQHAVRLSITIMVAITLEEELKFPHSYWIPMTVAWITRPDRDGTVERTILRVVGTLIGIGLAGTFIVVFDPGNPMSVLMTSVAVFIVLTFLVPNYAIAVTGITIFVFFLFNIVGYPIEQMIETRIAATLIAAVLVTIAIHLGRRPAALRTTS